MSTFSTTVSSPLPPADVFTYMARFSNAAEWDPGVVSAEDVTPGPPVRGSRYLLVVGFLTRKVPLEYRIEEIDAPRRVVLQAENSMISSTDIIEVSPGPDGGSTIAYEANLNLKGKLALFSPLAALAFRRVGERAASGLSAALAT